jgi:VWFA-related protein
MNRCLAIVFTAALIAVPALLGARQSPQSTEGTFRGGTHTVSVYATVVDRSGRLVPNLTQDDFIVFDDGAQQHLSVFRNDTQPITIVVMLDRSGSMISNARIVRDAAEQFVTDLLPEDKAKIGSFAERIEIDPAAFTSDKNELLRILHYNLQNGGPTPLWLATNSAMTALEHQEGRRVVLMFTDGYDSPDRSSWRRMTLNDVIKRSQAEEIMVYAIGLSDTCGGPSAPAPAPSSAPRPLFQRGRGRPPGFPGRFPPMPGGGRLPFPGPPPVSGGSGSRPSMWCMGSAPDPGLKVLAEEAGGGYFELHKTDDFTATFARVADELHHQYLLGFSATAQDGRLHTLEVRLRDPQLTARARKSYLAPAAQ